MKNNKRKKYHALIILLGAFIPLIILPHCFEKIRLNLYIEDNNIFEDIYMHCENEVEDINLIYLEKNDSWYAFLPAHIANCNIQFFHKNDAFTLIDEKDEVNPEISLQETENGTSLKLTIKHGNDIISSGNVIILQADYVPTMYVNTNSGSMEYIHSSKDNKEQAFFTIYQSDGEIDSIGECVIKGRGNSSWAGGMSGKGEKKPYNINLSSETSLLGMDSQTKWTLLACYDDPAFIRNKITFELAQRLECEYSPQAEFVNLYTNGEYKGLYLLTQRIAVDGSFIDIHNLEQLNKEINTAHKYEIYRNVDDDLEEHAIMLYNNPDNISGGYLLEFDARLDTDVTGWFTTNRNIIGIKSPDPVSVEQANYIADYVRNVEEIVFDNTTQDSSSKNYLDYIDIDSWAKMYVLQDFLLNFDVSYSSFYMYKEADDPYIYAGPVWDFDLSMGNLHLGEYVDFTKQVQWIEGNDNGLWLYALRAKPEFLNSVQAIYQNEFWNILNEITTKDIPLWAEQLETSANIDSILWNRENYHFSEKVSNVLNWLKDRKQFIIEYNTNPENYNKAIFQIDKHRSFVYCIKKGNRLNYIPDFEGYVWVDEAGNVADTETVITEDTVFVPNN